MVDPATIRVPRPVSFHCLFYLGRLSGNTLLARSKRCQLSLTVLFARNIWRVATLDFRRETSLVAILACILSRPAGSMGAGGLQADLLLLSWSLLQSVLG